VLPENVDAWEIFQLASNNPWGITPQEVISLCRIKGVEDVEECMKKVFHIGNLIMESGKEKDK